MKKIFNLETKNLVGREVVLFGFVNSIRDHGKLFFFDLKDRSGIVQCVISQENNYFGSVKEIKNQSVVMVKGQVQQRPPHLANPHLPTGKVEVVINEIQILSQPKTLPFEVDSDGYEIDEALRLKYRYLDLRRARLQNNLRKRHEFLLFIRNFLDAHGFIEIETPILTKSTPEGARDYLVPSRIYPGKFYALPQSPQQYKQLLMVAGLERYFQIARCFRDEDPRGDRQPEFTQLDMEMSYVNRDDILSLVEKMFVEVINQLYPQKRIKTYPFPRLTYEEAISIYGSDKPDLRNDPNDPNELAFAFIVDFPMFEVVNDKLETMHHPFTQPRLPDGKSDRDALFNALEKSPESLLSEQYDLVLNGYEIGGGSIRTTDPEILIKVFEILGHERGEVEEKFGHLLEAFSYGVPPHGGIAPGIDRILMILNNEPNIREVIAFPKTGEGRDLMMNSPSEIEKKQLDELSIQIRQVEN
ncbi:MAG: aspartate--tRNA ligase [Patescibacteria group bacterium]|nr:aspartate--tRNA ligase [Patescibacteria group bacterium]